MAAIDRYLKYAVSLEASDLHLSGNTRPMMRVHGTMLPALGEQTQVLDEAEMDRLVEEIMPSRSKTELAERLDTDFAYAVEGLGRFRVNVFRNHRGTGAVLRHIPGKILTFEELKLPQSLAQFCLLNKGLVLVTGPTGSGKSTTLAAMVDYINTHRQDHIITIEDPIEFVHENKQCRVSQREVKEHAESFERALRAALREDPDIVLVGEMRDLETTETAIETAETGHLVLGTLHTSTAATTIDRIIDQFPSRASGSGAHHVGRLAERGRLSDPLQAGRWRWPRRGSRDHGGHTRHGGQHSRWQDPSDPDRHPDGQERSACSCSTRIWFVWSKSTPSRPRRPISRPSTRPIWRTSCGRQDSASKTPVRWRATAVPWRDPQPKSLNLLTLWAENHPVSGG